MINNTLKVEYLCNRQSGYTLIEIVMVMVMIGVLTAVAVVKWPAGMGEDASVLEFKRAARYAQHMALTRQFHRFQPGESWFQETDIRFSAPMAQPRPTTT